MKLTPIAMAAASLCRGYTLPRVGMSLFAYLQSGGPMRTARMAAGWTAAS